MNRLLRRLRALPRLALAYETLRGDVEELLRDPHVRAALERCRKEPSIAAAVPRISAEWRAVEEAVNQLR